MNYIPIALIRVLCKLMEWMIKRLLYYLENNKISKFQCGGRECRSTNDFFNLFGSTGDPE